MPQKYRLICVLDSVIDGEKTLSELDASPDYLHIHILESNQVESIEEFSKKLSSEPKNHTLFQWGIPLNKDAGTRTAKVDGKIINSFGDVGLGSAMTGKGEWNGDYIGGGEGFLFDKDSLRITKGNAFFTAPDNQNYWTFQVADFDGALKINNLNGSLVEGRKNLMELLKEQSEGKPFVAVFDVKFKGRFFARSNGIFPEDKDQVKDPDSSLFDSDKEEIKGGHLVGGSDNPGDIESLGKIFSQPDAKKQDFVFTIESSVILKKIGELQIAGPDGSFRPPRTAIEVADAIEVIEGAWHKQK
jgi:hypothetical protein